MKVDRSFWVALRHQLVSQKIKGIERKFLAKRWYRNSTFRDQFFVIFLLGPVPELFDLCGRSMGLY
jgi:hypothetical protein